MVAALPANGVPHAYLAFEGEQHGFRKSETVIRCLEAELSFYAQVFGFEPADDDRAGRDRRVGLAAPPLGGRPHWTRARGARE